MWYFGMASTAWSCVICDLRVTSASLMIIGRWASAKPYWKYFLSTNSPVQPVYTIYSVSDSEIWCLYIFTLVSALCNHHGHREGGY